MVSPDGRRAGALLKDKMCLSDVQCVKNDTGITFDPESQGAFPAAKTEKPFFRKFHVLDGYHLDFARG